MRNLFYSYYRLTKEEYEKLWQEGIFAFDTNVLLDAYRYTQETREKLFELLSQLKHRIWIPHQVAFEYHENRLEVISQQLKAADEIEKLLNRSLEHIQKELLQYKKHPFADVEHILSTVEKAIGEAQIALQSKKTRWPDFFKSDELLDKLTDLFEDRVGQPYSNEELVQIYEEAELRFKEEIPPGYPDAKTKHDKRKYGDFIIWSQLIDKMKSEKKLLILITGERKEDWWHRYKGRTLGPRRELIQEVSIKADVLFYMYSIDHFLVQAESFLGLYEQQNVIEEIRKVRELDEEKANTQRLGRLNRRARIGAIIRMDNQIIDVTEDTASEMVLTAWSLIQEELLLALKRVNLLPDNDIVQADGIPFIEYMAQLADSGYIETEELQNLLKMLTIRNLAIHSSRDGYKVSANDAAKYARETNRILSILSTIGT